MVDLEPVRGAEASKRRPAVIVSNDAANTTTARFGRGVVTVVPVTRVHPFQVLIPQEAAGLGRAAKAQAEQVRSIAVERVGEPVGRLPSLLLRELDEALRLHLAL